MNAHNETTLLQCPRMTQIAFESALRVLNLIAVLCAGTKTQMTALVCLKIVELNMKYGMSNTMPVAIAWYGVMLKRSGRFPVAEAYKYAGIALKLQDELKSYGSHAQVAAICHGMINSTLYNFSECIKPLEDGHIEGLQAGDVRHAMICAHILCSMTFYSGRSLTHVAATLEKYSQLMREYNTPAVLGVNFIYEQVVKLLTSHLRPSRKQSFTLKGSISPNKTQMEKEHASAGQALTAYILDDYPSACKASEEFRKHCNMVSMF